MTPARRLYVLAPAVGDLTARAGGFATELGTALRVGAGAAAVLLRLPDDEEARLINIVAGFAPIVQGAGVALLLDGRPDLVAHAGADGTHLAGPDAVKAALPGLKPKYIVGAGRLASRHDAMIAAEAGADYVMFGEPDHAGRRPGFNAVRERVAWWAELFEVPCVAYASDFEEIAMLAAAGADFVAVGDAVLSDPRGLVAAMTEAYARLAIKEAAA